MTSIRAFGIVFGVLVFVLAFIRFPQVRQGRFDFLRRLSGEGKKGRNWRHGVFFDRAIPGTWLRQTR